VATSPKKKSMGLELFNRLRPEGISEETPESLVWAEIPPSFDEFVTSKSYLGQMPLSTRQSSALNKIFGKDPTKIFSTGTLENVLLWGKGCLLAGERITLADGSRVPIEKLTEETFVLSFTDDGMVSTVASPSFEVGEGACVEVVTKSGRKIRCFVEHQFLTNIRQWVSVSDLSIGDFIALPLSLPVVGEFSAPAEARLIGYLIGDGSCSSNDSCPLLKCENIPEIVSDLSISWEAVAGRPPRTSIDRNCLWFGGGLTPWETRNGENAVYELVKRVGLLGSNSYSKKIPDECFTYDDESAWQLLSGLWMTDGWVCPITKPYKGTGNRSWEFGYGSQSEELIRGIAEILHRFGIVARIKLKNSVYDGKPYQSWVLKVRTRADVSRMIKGLKLAGPKALQLELAKVEIENLSLFGKGHRALGDVYWDRIESITPIGNHPFYDIEVEGPANYVAQGILHHNSGKDLVSSYGIAYITYCVLCLRDPHEFFGMAKGENIDIINIASNAQQANQVFFSKLKQRLDMDCFKKFKPKPGKSLYEFPHINLRLHSLHAANESWEGYNILAWVMDEASAFRSANGNTDNAEACYSTLRTSANSRFPAPRYRWIGIIISFPRKQVGDFTYDKWKESEHNPEMYSDKACHWEVNPRFDPQHPLYISEMEWVVLEEFNLRVPKPFESEFRKDPTEAKTKYMCDPPPQAGGFFELPIKITEAVNKELPSLVFTRTVVNKPVHQMNRLSGEMELMEFKYVANLIESMPLRQAGCEYFIHGDPGLINDAFSLCVCHTVPQSRWIVDADGVEREVKLVVVDFILTWEPTPTTPVDLMNVDETILKIAKYYGVYRVTFDKWNSAGSIQRLMDNGILAEDMSFSLPEQLKIYRNLKMLFYNNLIEIPDYPELINELIYLKVENGKITHDAYGKDRADSLAAATYAAVGEVLSEADMIIRETIGEAYAGYRRGIGEHSHTTVQFRW
jgi:intein/homing endonuclease